MSGGLLAPQVYYKTKRSRGKEHEQAIDGWWNTHGGVVQYIQSNVDGKRTIMNPDFHTNGNSLFLFQL